MRSLLCFQSRWSRVHLLLSLHSGFLFGGGELTMPPVPELYSVGSDGDKWWNGNSLEESDLWLIEIVSRHSLEELRKATKKSTPWPLTRMRSPPEYRSKAVFSDQRVRWRTAKYSEDLYFVDGSRALRFTIDARGLYESCRWICMPDGRYRWELSSWIHRS
jgi:hypothetical protein